MIAPILRLLAIYLAVGLAVFGFFKRDALMGLFSGGGEPVAQAQAPDPAQPAPAVDPAPAPDPEPVYAPLPADGDVTLSDDALQAPVAVSEPAAVAPTAPETPAPAAVSSQPVATPQPTPASEPTPSTTDEPAYEQGLNAARRAYWQGDMQAAIAQYRKMLSQYPEDESLNGELGNIFYMTGDRENAAQHLEKAGMAALNAGKTQQAQMLVGVLQSLDAGAAARLTSAIGAAQ